MKKHVRCQVRISETGVKFVIFAVWYQLNQLKKQGHGFESRSSLNFFQVGFSTA